jgi:NDP-sugar pyrophosphorylase family protein
MKAMILAAGLGTRLRPLTDDRPKALVEIAGHTLLEITLYRLRTLGIREVILNVHHFAGMIRDYLAANQNFGMHIAISHEVELLDTGGGLKKASHFLQDSEPFILHNVDVLSTIDLDRMAQFHRDNQALATLAVKDRETSRYLLFNDRLQLCGRRVGPSSTQTPPGSSQTFQALAFSGIHVISPRIFGLMTEQGAFPIMDVYLRLASEGEKVVAFRADHFYWRDLGRPADLPQAAQDLKDLGLEPRFAPKLQ